MLRLLSIYFFLTFYYPILIRMRACITWLIPRDGKKINRRERAGLIVQYTQLVSLGREPKISSF